MGPASMHGGRLCVVMQRCRVLRHPAQQLPGRLACARAASGREVGAGRGPNPTPRVLRLQWSGWGTLARSHSW